MPGIYIGSTAAFSGKNLLTLGLGLWFQAQGLRLGYMKPVGAVPTTAGGRVGDDDAFFVRRTLGLATEGPQAPDPALVTPVLVTPEFQAQAFLGNHPDLRQRIAEAYATLARDTDLMLVAGSGSMYSGRYCGVDGLTLVRALELRAVVIDRYESELQYDTLLALREALGERLAGVVFNDVPEEALAETSQRLVPFLATRGVRTLGVLPRDELLSAISVADLTEKLGGRVLTAPHRVANRVEGFMIGTMQVENFLAHFRRRKTAAVIVGGDRSDVQLVAMEGQTPCLILTGNLPPSEVVLTRAELLEVPLVAVRDDTFSIAKKMEALLARHKLRDQAKIDQGARLVARHLDMPLLQRLAG